MSAKADAEAAAALRELGATLKASKEEGRRGKPGDVQFPIVFGYSFLSDTYPDVS
jgi:hypothetical protein